jgi:hypothetical protein
MRTMRTDVTDEDLDPVDLSRDEATRLVESILRRAAPGGLRESQIQERYDKIRPGLIELKIQAGIWEAIGLGLIDVDVDETGELCLYPRTPRGGT